MLLKCALPALAGVKTVNFLPNLLGRAEAKRTRGLRGHLRRYERIHVLEGTASNIFIVKKRRHQDAAPIEEPALDRRTARHHPRRGNIAERTGPKAYPLKRSRISTAELKRSDEAFLTSSTMGVVPLVEVDGKSIRPGWTGGPSPGSLLHLKG